MPIEQGMNKLCPMSGYGPNLLHIAARGIRPGGRCPDCRRASRAVHSRYRRHPADLPSLGRRVHVRLRARRFYCRNVKCARRTFAERLPELVPPHARRTARFAEAQSQVGGRWAARRGRGCYGAWPCRRVPTQCCAWSAAWRCPSRGHSVGCHANNAKGERGGNAGPIARGPALPLLGTSKTASSSALFPATGKRAGEDNHSPWDIS